MCNQTSPSPLHAALLKTVLTRTLTATFYSLKVSLPLVKTVLDAPEQHKLL